MTQYTECTKACRLQTLSAVCRKSVSSAKHNVHPNIHLTHNHSQCTLRHTLALPFTQHTDTMLSLRGDRQQQYLHGQYSVDVSFLPRTKNSNRGHSLKLQKQSSELKVTHDLFSLRVVDLWSSLPESAVSAPSLNSFKNRLDKFWIKYKFSEDPPQIKSHYSTEDVTSDNEDQSTG